MLLFISQSSGIPSYSFVPIAALPSGMGHLGLSLESSMGSGEAPSLFLPVSSGDFTDGYEYDSIPNLNNSIEVQDLVKRSWSVGGSIDLEAVPIGMISLLKSALWATASTVALADRYQHTIDSGYTPYTLSVETSISDVLVVRRTGMIVESMEISAKFGEVASSTFSMRGSASIRQSSVAVPGYYNVNPFSFAHASVKIDAVEISDISSFSLSVNNSVEVRPSLRKSLLPHSYVLGGKSITISLAVEPEAYSYFDRVNDATDCEVRLLLESPTVESMEIILPNVRFSGTSSNLSTSSPTQDVVGTAYRKLGASSLSVVISNLQSGQV